MRAQNAAKFNCFKTYNHTLFVLRKTIIGSHYCARRSPKTWFFEWSMLLITFNNWAQFKCVNINERARKLYHVRVNIGSRIYHVQGYKALNTTGYRRCTISSVKKKKEFILLFVMSIVVHTVRRNFAWNWISAN